ncbi:MAG: type VI secretion system tip protein TssI/VgrG [Thermodesulfobacteriota bacterium]
MAAVTQASTYLTFSSPLGADKLLVRSMRGEERISEPFRFDLELYSEDAALSFDSIVGKNACVTVTMPDDTKRYVNGVVARFAQGGRDHRHTTYFAELRPWFWVLRQHVDCRVFQEMTALEIIEKVFGDLSYTDFENKCTGSFATRDYCVMYQESSFDFVSRLLEDEGCYYYFTHAADKHTLVLANAADAYAAAAGPATVAYEDQRRVDWPEQIVTSCRLEKRVIPKEFWMDDYNFETPATDLHAASSGSAGKHGLCEYPGGFTEKAKGETKAGLRLDAFEAEEKQLAGESHCRGFFAGAKFTLENHPRSDANAEYVLAEVRHEASHGGYRNTFTALPATVVARPRVKTRRPRIHGAQTAVVKGKSGEEIWTDKYGRIKVRFHWDHKGDADGYTDEKSSCWVRVAHSWAGKGWGSIFVPRVGMEVVVSFLDGDPDRPLVTGCVYNATQTVPYALPANQTRSTVKSESSKEGAGKFNEIRFEDKKDSEEIYVHAQKDHKTEIENNRTVILKEADAKEGDDSLTVEKGNRTVTLKKGNLTTTLDEGDETHELKKGNRTLKVKGNQNVTVEGNYTLTVKGNLTISVDGEVKLTGKKNVKIEATQNLNAKGSQNATVEAGQNLTAKGGMNADVEAGANLTAKAGVNAKLDGGAMTEVKGGAQAKVSGPMVDVNGSAMVKIAGGMIKVG